ATGWTSEMFREAVAHPAFDTFWRAISTKEHLNRIHVPVFSVGGWYDNFAESDLAAFAELHKTSGLNRIIIGPWAHSMSYKFEEAAFGPASGVPIRAIQLEWFDQWLMGKDSKLMSGPPVQIFVMGVNRWREETSWPPDRAREQDFFLESHGKANTLDGDGVLG